MKRLICLFLVLFLVGCGEKIEEEVSLDFHEKAFVDELENDIPNLPEYSSLEEAVESKGPGGGFGYYFVVSGEFYFRCFIHCENEYYLVERADLKTFEQLTAVYGKDKDYIYFKEKILVEADLDTFVVENVYKARDEDIGYYGDITMDYPSRCFFDLTGFEFFNDQYSGDGEKYYINGCLLEGEYDYDTFEFSDFSELGVVDFYRDKDFLFIDRKGPFQILKYFENDEERSIVPGGNKMYFFGEDEYISDINGYYQVTLAFGEGGTPVGISGLNKVASSFEEFLQIIGENYSEYVIFD